MSEYTISRIWDSDKKSIEKINTLLKGEDILLDKHLDYTCALFDENGDAIATGSLFLNTLRCMAVDSRHQGEGLLNEIVSHLIDTEFERGYTELFLYTKPSAVKFFSTLGFNEITRVDDKLVFMENSKTGFKNYLTKLSLQKKEGSSAAIVMNANPFTLGHRYLVEQAAKENDWVHLFIVSEDSSLFPFSVRKRLLTESVADLKNVLIHESGPYIISNATFPSYFLKDDDCVVKTHAALDLKVFSEIAKALNIGCRYVGEEPFSRTTALYNSEMMQSLPQYGITCKEIQRLCAAKGVISASTVRECIKNEDMASLECMVTKATFDYLNSTEAAHVISKIKASVDVIHH